MASILKGVTDSIETLVVANTSLVDLRQGPSLQHTGEKPFGIITYGAGIISSQGLDGAIDNHLSATITIVADDWEGTQLALEELMVVFMDETVFNALVTANTNIIDFKITSYTPAQLAEGNLASLSKFVGQAKYDLHLRYTY